MTDKSELAQSAFIEAVSLAAEQYRQSITTKFEDRERSLRNAYHEKEKEQDATIASLRRVLKILQSRLDGRAVHSPKASLPGHVRSFEAGPASSPGTQTMSPPPIKLHDAVSITDLQAAYSKLLTKFQLVESNFKKAKDLLARRKTEREHWTSHTALLQEKLNALQNTDGHASSSARMPDAPAEAERSRPTASPDAVILREERPVLAGNVEVGAPERQTPGSTQSDAEEGAEVTLPPLPANIAYTSTTIKEEPSSDSPVVVSERPVKKRKRDSDRVQPGRTQVKVEAGADSSPIPRLNRIMLNSEASLDLDDVAQRIATPRKRRDTAHPNDSLSQVQSADQPAPPLAIVQAQPGLYAKATPKALRPAPLTPIDANRGLSNAAGRAIGKTGRAKDLEEGIGTLAEDGANYELDRAISKSKFETPVAKGRLDDLLNNPGSGMASPDISRSVARRTAKASRTRDDFSMPRPRELPFERSARASGKQSDLAKIATPSPSMAARNRSPKQRELGPPQRQAGVLRRKPPGELTLDDFKINPRTNGGVGYAYSEVVRDKSERAAMPGCTDPHCCGQEFRNLALSQKPNPPLTSEQRREEQRLLEDFLGDHAYKLAAMDKTERADIWIDAKTHELANKYGKHRHRHSRMRSPPGFWNADFPSTQEIEAEKVEAAKRERKSVEERRREAMQPNGRWVFRDE